jgi:beta-lactamase regulating signal transducer with metallopeptidase domain
MKTMILLEIVQLITWILFAILCLVYIIKLSGVLFNNKQKQEEYKNEKGQSVKDIIEASFPKEYPGASAVLNTYKKRKL